MKLTDELNMKLKIPRLHLEFLKSKGALDHFVSAKLKGDDVNAKWMLLKSGKNEINKIYDKHQDNIRNS